MVFASNIFILYFLPIFFTVYWLIHKKFKNGLLLLASLFFYAWGAPQFVFVIIATTTIDFFIVQQMSKQEQKNKRTLYLFISLAINLGLLFYFKYANFFIDNVNILLNGLGIKTNAVTKIILPIGISFFTFESLTYVIDVYRKVHKPLSNFYTYQTYIILFPKLIAGPIIRYHDIASQLTDRWQNENNKNRLAGFLRFCIGLGKKVMIANVLAVYANAVFDNDAIHHLNTLTCWLGMLAYSLQIYFDFSGYSDMAIGLGKMLGFNFPENFDSPYTAKSITSFWQKWHITLGTWMRNYLYIPLGGNRVKKHLAYLNLVLVFLCSGFWHGANWTFICWGLFHGFFIVFDKITIQRITKILGVFSIPFCFLIVMFGWVIFRCDNMLIASKFFNALFSFQSGIYVAFNNELIFILIIAILFSFIGMFENLKINLLQLYNLNIKKQHTVIYFIFCILVLLYSVATLSATSFNPFIYFRF